MAQDTNQPAQVQGLNGYSVDPVFTIGETFVGGSQGDYTPPGILDGLGAFAFDEDTIRILANHELRADVGYTYTLENGTELTGARVSYFDVDKTSLEVVDAGLAYNTIVNRLGEVVDDASDLEFGGLNRFCSATYIEANQFGDGRGLTDGIFFTGEETSGGTEYALDVATNTLYAVPWLGRAAWENITELDTGTTDKVALLVGDDREAAPLLLYVGEKDTSQDAGFLARNGLSNGKLYAWSPNGEIGDSPDDEDSAPDPTSFNGTGESLTGTWVELDYYRPDLASEDGASGYDSLGFATQEQQDQLFIDAGGFQFSRPEDVATNPEDGTQAVLASTGRGGRFPEDNWGTVYRVDVDFSETGDPVNAQLDILYDGDDAGNGQFTDPDWGLRSPDNLDWSEDGNIYIQEDRSTSPRELFGGISGQEASIWQLIPDSGDLTRIGQIDRDALPEGQTDPLPDDIGTWETSGILDVSNLFDEDAGTRFIFGVQAHSLRDGIIESDGLVEGGQLAFLTQEQFETLEVISRYPAGIPEGEEGGAEISAYDPESQRLYVVNAFNNAIDIIGLNDPTNPVLISSIDIDPVGASVNSVAFNDGILAVAVARKPGEEPGRVAFYNFRGTLLNQVTVGALPDMVTFTPDGTKLLVANEGEPGEIDPEGSISIIDISGGVENATVTTAGFTAFNGQEEELRSRGVRIFPDKTFAEDAEPEYIAVSSDSSTAYVTLQENNAIAVVDIAAGEVTEIQPLGTKNYSPGTPQLTQYPWDLSGEVLGTTPAGQEILLGGMSGLFYEGTTEDGRLQFIATPDRGPNGEPTDVDNDGENERPFPLPDYQARLIRFTLDRETSNIEITEQINLFREDGTTPITGLPNLQAGEPGTAYTDEEAVDLNGNTLENDPFGADMESILVAPDGTFWLSDEYRPAIYHFDAEGTLINRFIPEGTAAAAGADAGSFGTETLPAVYAQRRANRGFEGMALNTDNGRLYAFIQSPIDNPDISNAEASQQGLSNDQNSRNSQVLRILEVDPTTGQPTGEYVYFLEGSPGVDKIGDAVYAGDGKFYVIERDSGTESDSKKFIFEVDLTGATNILGTDLSTATDEENALEGKTADELLEMEVQAVTKTKILNLPSIGYVAGDKPEGLALLDDGSLAVINDNDFGLLDEEIPIDGSVPFNPDPVQTVLGIIEFDPLQLDASDEDGGINLQNYPIFGLFQPDAVATYEVGGETFYVTANEGDARDEDARVADLTLDPTAFPNAEELQQDAVLGRLEVSTIDGDLDGDGDYDQLFAYGGRSFSIWDSRGNLVYDSGDELETITSQLFPELFNSEGTIDSLDSRSYAKSIEPEGVVVGEVNGTPYAFIGLERISGVMVYDISEPTNAEFVDYINPTDENGNAIDLGPEGLTFISAEDSPNGEPILVVTNEISNTTTILTPPEETFTLQLLHAADQEAGVSALEDAPNFSAVLNALRDDFENTLVLSSGDAYIPGPFFSASDSVFGGQGRGDILIQNELGFQAIAFGNHEFDLGTATVADLIQPDPENNYPGAQFPYLSSNLDFSTDENLAPLVTEDGQEASTIPNQIAGNTIITVNDEKIGIVGATTPTLSSISSPGDVGIAPLEFDSANPEDIAALAAEIQASVDSLLEANPDMNKVILLAHMQQISIEEQLAELLTDVDIIVAAGSNTLLADETDRLRAGDEAEGVYPILKEDAEGTPVAVVNTDGNYQYVGRLVVDFDADGVIIPESIDPNISGAYATDAEGVAAVEGTPDPEIVAITDQLQEVVATQEGNIFGNTEVFLNGTRGDVRTQETNLGNLTADANLAIAQSTDETVVISIKNGGAIRDNIGEVIVPPGATDPDDFINAPPPANELAGKEEGDISQLDISNSLRFNNGLSLLTLTAQELLRVIEHGVAETEDGATPGRFPQVSGINFSFDATREAGDRVISLAVVDEDGALVDTVVENGELVGDANRTFRTVTLDFLADGGDQYPFPTGEAVNRVDLVTEEEDNPTPEIRTGVATFAPDGSEQDALAEYLAANFDETSFNLEDTDPGLDTRIQNLAVREDTALDGTDVVNLDTDIFRFRRTTDATSSYLYVAQEEAESIRTNFSDIYTEEGLAFQVAVEPDDPLIAIYRFQSINNPGRYLYVGEEERASINTNFAESFIEEGLAFYVYGVGAGDATEFTRFRHLNAPETYIYATGAEAESIRTDFANTFEEEGAAFEVEI